MSSNGGDRDRDLGRLFEEKRRTDESSAPSLRGLIARPRDHRAPRARALWRAGLAMAATVVLLASVVLLRARLSRAPEAQLPPVAAQIAAWRAPSDVLLQTPGSDLLSQLPVLESHAPETATVVFEPTKGVER